MNLHRYVSDFYEGITIMKEIHKFKEWVDLGNTGDAAKAEFNSCKQEIEHAVKAERLADWQGDLLLEELEFIKW
jgi:hypothetical protein